MRCSILHGDVLDMLAKIGDAKVQCVVTSPPYWNLRDYGVDGQLGLGDTPAGYVVSMVKVFREVRRVMRDDGTLWLNLGDSYCSQAPGKRDADRWPKQERNGHPGFSKLGFGMKPKDLVGIPWMVAFALREDGWHLRSDIIWAKPNPMPESVTDRPTKSHEHVFLLTKSERYRYDAAAIKEPSKNPTDDRHARAKVGQKSNPTDKLNGCRPVVRVPTGWDTSRGRGGHGSFHKDGRASAPEHRPRTYPMRNKRDVWTIATRPFPDAHFATFPEKLVVPCVLAGSTPNSIVMDPFCGAGTVGVVALGLGRHFVGIEINQKYVDMGRRRIMDKFGLLVEECAI